MTEEEKRTEGRPSGAGQNPPHKLGSRKIFGRELDYLRDLALFWPFVLCTMFSAGFAFSPGDRYLALKFAGVAITALVLAREKLVLLVLGLGFTAIRCAITLALHPWKWSVFTVGILTAAPFLLANRSWHHPKLAYKLPNEPRLVDALWSVAAIIGSLAVAHLVNPFN